MIQGKEGFIRRKSVIWHPLEKSRDIPAELVLCTNNLAGRKEDGSMSHVWLGKLHKIKDTDQTVAEVTVGTAVTTIANITYWAYPFDLCALSDSSPIKTSDIGKLIMRCRRGFLDVVYFSYYD